MYPATRLLCPSDGVVLPLEGRLLGGKFRLDRCVGDGGMASVWQATNTLVHRSVAIKLMHARYAGDAELLARFRNEASAAGKIGSPHICDVLDFGESEIGPYIVMELLEGCSLAELVQAHRRLDPGLAVWIVRQALDGLEAAHRAGIVHRDLKPENIYLCRAIRGQWLVKLMDFGISKFANHDQTAAGTTMGTPHYMAPEQIQRAASVDARADLWSIGVILHESITGVQLFARASVAEALAALRTYDPPPIQQLVADLPRGLAEVVARCLQRDPARRFASAQALAQALAAFERPGPRLDVEAATARRTADTLKKQRSSAPLPAPLARTGAAPRTGAQPVVPAASKVAGRTGAQPIVPAATTGPAAGRVAGTGAQPVVSAARKAVSAASSAAPSASPAAVRPGTQQAAASSQAVRSGSQAVRSGSKAVSSGSQAVSSGSQAVRSGSKAVPSDMRRTGPQGPRAPLAASARAWLWGALLALLGGGVLVFALLRHG